MSRIAAASFVAAIAAHASGQDAPAGGPIAPVDVTRAVAPVEFTLAFKFGEEGAARLLVRCDEVAGPADGSVSGGETCHLVVDFDPFEGVRWSWSRATNARKVERTALLQVPEPKGLDYELRFRFPPDRGIEVTLADGFPILVATRPLADSLRISFETSGIVVGLTATPAQTTGDPRLAQALAQRVDVRGEPDDEPEPPPADRGVERWSAVSLIERESPPIFAQRPIDERTTREGRIERVILELAEMVEVPTLLLRPLGDGRHPATLLVAGGANGKSQPAVVDRAAALAAAGSLVVAIDLLGSGERREIQPQDALTDFELELVGRPAAERAAQEIRQLLAWLRQRPDVDPARVELVVDDATEAALRSVEALAGAATEATLEPVAASPALVDAAVFGEDHVRPRYDSWLLGELVELREQLAAPDRSLPLAARIGGATIEAADPAAVRLWWNPRTGALAQLPGSTIPPSIEGPVVFCVSDFGRFAALDAATRALPPPPAFPPDASNQDVWYVTIPCGAGGDDLGDPAGGLAARSNALASEIEGLSEQLGGRRLRLFGEGSGAVGLLHVAALHPTLVESVTALHAIPSFELLLRRPQEARRAPPSLGVLTQGMPAELFVRDALARYDLEDCVLELRGHGVPVDWREPVDALRRPLSRHDRLAMWPRLRHAERKP